MIWLWVLLVAALTIGGMFWIGKLPAAARPLAGAAVMLVIAAMIEAFWSPAPLPASLKYAVGGGLWCLVALYLALSGGRR